MGYIYGIYQGSFKNNILCTPVWLQVYGIYDDLGVYALRALGQVH